MQSPGIGKGDFCPWLIFWISLHHIFALVLLLSIRLNLGSLYDPNPIPSNFFIIIDFQTPHTFKESKLTMLKTYSCVPVNECGGDAAWSIYKGWGVMQRQPRDYGWRLSAHDAHATQSLSSGVFYIYAYLVILNSSQYSWTFQYNIFLNPFCTVMKLWMCCTHERATHTTAAIRRSACYGRSGRGQQTWNDDTETYVGRPAGMKKLVLSIFFITAEVKRHFCDQIIKKPWLFITIL